MVIDLIPGFTFRKSKGRKINNGFSLQNIVYNLDLIHWAVGETLPVLFGI